VTVATLLLGKFLGIMSGLSLGTRVTGRCAHTNKHTHTSNERIISAIHFVHLAEIRIWHGRGHVTPKIFRVPLVCQDRVKLRMWNL